MLLICQKKSISIISGSSKQNFIKNIKELEELAYKLGPTFEKRLQEAKERWNYKGWVQDIILRTNSGSKKSPLSISSLKYFPRFIFSFLDIGRSDPIVNDQKPLG